MNYTFLGITAVALLALLMNVLIYKLIVSRALKTFIIPALEAHGLTLLSYKWAGLFSCGKFKSTGFGFRPFSKMGSPNNSTYINLFYTDGMKTKSITAKIETMFLAVRKVNYSNEL